MGKSSAADVLAGLDLAEKANGAGAYKGRLISIMSRWRAQAAAGCRRFRLG
jgi:hypothetical protein